MTTYFLQDTFTGSGDLSTHVGETGATWSLAESMGTGLSNCALDGSGNLIPGSITYGGGDYPGNLVKSSGVPGGLSFSMEAVLTMADPGVTGGVYYPSSQFTMFAVDDPSPAIYDGFEVSVIVFDHTTNLNLYYADASGTPANSTGFVDTGVPAGTPFTLRVDAQDSDKSYSVYIDGVLLMQHTVTTLPTVTACGVCVWGDGATAANIHVDRVAGWDIITPPFWTAFNHATERDT